MNQARKPESEKSELCPLCGLPRTGYVEVIRSLGADEASASIQCACGEKREQSESLGSIILTRDQYKEVNPAVEERRLSSPPDISRLSCSRELEIRLSESVTSIVLRSHLLKFQGLETCEEETHPLIVQKLGSSINAMYRRRRWDSSLRTEAIFKVQETQALILPGVTVCRSLEYFLYTIKPDGE